MENVLGFDYHELLANYIDEYAALKRMIAAGEQDQIDFEMLHFECRLIVLKLEEDFGIKLNELAEAKENTNVVNHLKALR